MSRHYHVAPLRELLTECLGGEATGHDVAHAERVLANALFLGRSGGRPFDAEFLEAAALLHDVLDHKLVEASAVDALRTRVAQALERAGFGSVDREGLFEVWQSMGYRGGAAVPAMPCYEGELLIDADRLDALGAVGIARCFAYGGKKGRALHDPRTAPQNFQDAESYRRHAGSSLAHFHEKLYHLESQMCTEAGRRVARQRTEFMREFERRFLGEWSGTDLAG